MCLIKVSCPHTSIDQPLIVMYYRCIIKKDSFNSINVFMKKIIIAGSLYALPFLALAQGDFSSIQQSLQTIIQIVNTTIIPLFIGIGVLVFIYGVIQYIIKAGDEEARKSARPVIIWGIIGIFVMVSVWGLVNILVSTFGLQQTKPVYPQI